MRFRTLSFLEPPDDVAVWEKPESTKNTTKKYSSFMEVMAFYRTTLYSRLHWSNRTGIFTDRLMYQDHPFKKPESLIERLILNHYPGWGSIYDPCAGSDTVAKVCKRLKIKCLSVEIAPTDRNPTGDCYAGSGTFLMAVMRLATSSITIEKDYHVTGHRIRVA